MPTHQQYEENGQPAVENCRKYDYEYPAIGFRSGVQLYVRNSDESSVVAGSQKQYGLTLSLLQNGRWFDFQMRLQNLDHAQIGFLVWRVRWGLPRRHALQLTFHRACPKQSRHLKFAEVDR